MRFASRSEGFTIVETLIVLAISGVLLLAAITFLSGKQNTTQFTQGTRDIESRLRAVINDVANGYYQNNGTLRCRDIGGVPFVDSFSTAQGTNKDCVFLGKVVQFNVGNADPEIFHVYSIVGLRQQASKTIKNLDEANPRVIQLNDMFDIETMPYGMKVATSGTLSGVRYNTLSPPVGAVAFLSSLAYIDDAGTTQGPSQQVDVYPIRGTAVGQTKAAAISAIERVPDVTNIGLRSSASLVNPAGGVTVCVNSGGTNQSVLYSIGGLSRQLTISANVKPKKDCAP